MVRTPGSHTGLNLSGRFGSLDIITGACYLAKDKQMEYGMFATNSFKDVKVGVGGYYSPKKSGLALTMDLDKTSWLVYLNSNDEASVYVDYTFPIFCPYFTFTTTKNPSSTVDDVKKNIVNLEIGLTKTFTTKVTNNLSCKTLIGIGHEFKEFKTTNLYVHIYF
ncbi:MAG: hypothetical protein NTY12_02695 [Candidatus Falkowbacteria bacterium]|nr:hypothetical protein [Candidatus Falkowbacteria bacterium]